MTVKELLEKRAETFSTIEELRKKDDAGEFSSEDEQQWTRSWADYDKFNTQLERAKQVEAARTDLDNDVDPDPPVRSGILNHTPDFGNVAKKFDAEEARTRAVGAWCKVANGIHASDEDRAAAMQVGINVNAPQIDVDLMATAQIRAEQRAAQTTTTTGGGYLIPEGFVPELEKAMLQFGPMRQVARILRTDAGNDLPWPTTNDTGNTGALLAENTQDTDTAVVFGVLTLNAYKLTSQLVLVPQELMEDSAFDMGVELGAILGERIGRGMNTYLTTGTGSSQPKGVAVAATSGKTAAATTAVTAAELVDLLHSVDPAYRNESTRWMMSDATLALIRKLREDTGAGAGTGAWMFDIANGSLLGWPVSVNQQMPAATAGLKPIAFGDFSKYIVREVNQVRLYRLEERYRDYDQTGFVAFMRFDGDLLDAGTNPIKVMTMAAS